MTTSFRAALFAVLPSYAPPAALSSRHGAVVGDDVDISVDAEAILES